LTEEAFLVIDAGSGSVKAFLISPTGMIINRSERLWDRDTWKSDEAWKLVLEAISELTTSFNGYILGISSTSMREEFIILDEAGKEISYKLSDESEKHGYNILSDYGKRMYENSGHWPVPNWMAGAILPWLMESNQAMHEKASRILMISDWVNFKLSGEAATEGSSACETSLFNISRYDWDWSMIDALDIPRGIFPEVYHNGELFGTTSKDISGIPEGTPVIMGGADTQCGLLGMGTFNGEVAAVGGTTTPVQMITDKPVFDSEYRTWSNNYIIKGHWILESNVGYTGRGIRWLRDEFLSEDHDYYEINRLVGEASVGSDGLLAYLGPHVFNSGPPYWPKDQLGDLPIEPTITGNHRFSVSTLARAIIEANSYGVRANLTKLQDISRMEFDELKFCGGNSRSELWMQIQADVLGIPVSVPLVHDASAVGTAILASIGAGYYDSVDDAVDVMVKPGKVYVPRPDVCEKYDAQYRRWMATREKLGGQ
jgi:sugar (pentulose or hexulose) kinase